MIFFYAGFSLALAQTIGQSKESPSARKTVPQYFSFLCPFILIQECTEFMSAKEFSTSFEKLHRKRECKERIAQKRKIYFKKPKEYQV